MKITIEHYGKTISWSNEFGDKGKKWLGGLDTIDETSIDDVFDAIHGLLITAGFNSKTIIDAAREFSDELSEEVLDKEGCPHSNINFD
jgi:hypothetical protein